MLDTTRLKTELGEIQAHLTRVVAGPRGGEVIAAPSLPATTNVGKRLWLALHSDCLRVVYAAISADQHIADEEIDATYDYLFSVARRYAELLPSTYAAFNALDTDTAREFLACYARDTEPFGYACDGTRWAGLDTCRRASVVGDDEPLERYARLLGWLCDEAMRIGAVDVSNDGQRARVAEITALRRKLVAQSAVASPGLDLRVETFLRGPRVFAAVTHADSVFEDDPFDVEEVHADVRKTFERLVSRAVTPIQHAERGRMMMVLGDSGAGKTHLMRAFRGHVHRGRHGFAAYAQLQSRAPEYSRYLLHNVIESLQRRYGAESDASGLLELARGLPRFVGDAMQRRVSALAEQEWTDEAVLARYVDGLIDDVLRKSELATFDPDLVRALLYLQCNDSRRTPRVLKYLRCEPMNDRDRKLIGDVQPRIGDDEPVWMIQQLARLASLTQGAAFVIMVDQVELAGFQTDPIITLGRAVDVLYAIVSAVPSSVAVVACLKDMYKKAAGQMGQSMIDRLTKDPPVATLAMERVEPEIAAIVRKRLEWLYGDAGAAFRPDEPTFPIPPTSFTEMVGMRTRSVLELCGQFQDACSAAGRVLDDWSGWKPGTGVNVDSSPSQPDPLDQLASEWNEFLHASSFEVNDDNDPEILDLLGGVAAACLVEIGTPSHVNRRELYLDVDIGEGAAKRQLTIAVTNRNYHRGAFGLQLERLRKSSRGRTPVAVRTIPFPRGAASDAAVAALVKAGGRKVLCNEADLRSLAAMQQFAAGRAGPALDAWRRRDRPVLARESLVELFAIEPVELPPPPVAPVSSTPPIPTKSPAPVVPRPKSTKSAAPVAPNGQLLVGTTVGLDARPFELSCEALVRHSGVLGSSGSGKTTLALNLIEQLLERDIAVVMVDRKGDLAGYARDGWYQNVTNAAARERAEALAARLDIRLFTPGTSAGRPLAFAAVPRLDGLPAHERSKLLGHASSALAGLLRLGGGTKDQQRRAILTQAIDLLAARTEPSSLETLIELISTRDDALVSRVSKFNDKLFGDLAANLDSVRLNQGELFDRDAEQLSAELLLGRGADGRTPLTIVSTKFLGDTERVQAWIAHLFVELSRWCAREPRSQLQALLMLDEADQYMPAGTVKPPSKEPLLDLLKRARSGGLGVMLATQTPGDLDYKSLDVITSWFIGKIGGTLSINKVSPLLERKPVMAGKLGGLPGGQFVVAHDGGVVEIQRRPSLLHTDQISDQEVIALARGGRL